MATIRYILILIVIAQAISCQDKKGFSLGNGVVKYDIWKNTNNEPIFLYKDSECTIPLVKLTIENTTCPTCMDCAEPTDYYKGPLKPFICGGTEGVVFVGREYGEDKYQIFIDTLGQQAYLWKHSSIKYSSWSDYMVTRGKNGDYFSFDRSWNKHVIYDKKYDITSLPKANKYFTVGATIKDIEWVKFYPVLVDGYWMKMKALRNGKLVGYYWVIWRNDKEWLIGFTFDAS